MRSLLPLSLLLTILDTPVRAYVFPFDVRFASDSHSSRSLSRRTPIGVKNIGNALYVSNVTVAGQATAVLLDTGSSDLWVHFPGNPPTAGMTDTGKSITLAYAVGKATGNVQKSSVSIGNLQLTDQAFLWVNDTSTFSTSSGYDGLLGLGPNQSSVIRKKVDKSGTSADNLLQRVFSQSASTENYITLLLDRKKDPSQNLTGQFTVSEVASGFENIRNMPKLDVDTVNRLLKSDQHWQALTDKNNGIIGPDGQPIQMKSIVPSAPSKTYVAVIDSGFTLSQVPRDVSDAIYGRVRGAVYDTTNEWWLVPCGQYLNVSFNFGGVNYPIHPLDLVDDNFSIIDSTGKKACLGAFQPITSAFSLLGHYDMILGMSFLRNAYSLYDFGYWISAANEDEHPFMQMVSLVDTEAARNDFIQVRLGGNASALNDPKYSLLPTADMQHSPVSDEEKKKKYQEWILSRWPYIFTGCLAFVLLVTGFVLWKCCCQRGKCCCKRKDGMGADGLGSGGRKGVFGMGGGHKKNQSSSASGLGLPGHMKRDSYVPLEAQNSRSVADLHSPSYKAPGSPRPSHSGSYSSNSNRNNNKYDSAYSASAADLTAPYIPPHSPRSANGGQHFSQNYDQGNYSTNSVHSYSGYQDGYGQQQQQQQSQHHHQQQQQQQQQQHSGYYNQQQGGYAPDNGAYHAR